MTTENAPADRLVKAAVAARYLGYSTGTVRNMASAGTLPCVKLPTGALRFRISELDAWIQTSQPKPEGIAS